MISQNCQLLWNINPDPTYLFFNNKCQLNKQQPNKKSKYPVDSSQL